MPTGKDLIKLAIKFIHAYCHVGLPDFDDEVDNDFITTDQAIANIKASNIPQIIKQLLDCFIESKLGPQFMIDTFTVPDRSETIDFNLQEFRKRNRPFSISNIQFGYLSCKKLLEFNPIDTIESDSEAYRTLIDFIGAALLIPINQLFSALLSVLEAGNSRAGLLVHKFQHNYSSISIYSYLYYQELLQGNSIDLDPGLNYTGSHGATTTFNHAVIYEQYFEVFDVVNELNHAKDIITRFLKMYHILEYLVYRVELVKIEEKARNNRTFIREINAIAGKGTGEKEWDTFRKNFLVIFGAEIRAGYFGLGVFNQQQLDFFKDYLGLNPYIPTDPQQVCQLIYKLRNSIVHNKESEFHMIMTNTDDYKEIIPLIIILIEKLERISFDKISIDLDKISYRGHQHIELY